MLPLPPWNKMANQIKQFAQYLNCFRKMAPQNKNRSQPGGFADRERTRTTLQKTSTQSYYLIVI